MKKLELKLDTASMDKNGEALQKLSIACRWSAGEMARALRYFLSDKEISIKNLGSIAQGLSSPFLWFTKEELQNAYLMHYRARKLKIYLQKVEK